MSNIEIAKSLKEKVKAERQEREAGMYINYINADRSERTWYRYMWLVIYNVIIGVISRVPETLDAIIAVLVLLFFMSFYSYYLTYKFGKGVSKTLFGDRVKVVYKWFSYISVTLSMVVILASFNLYNIY